MYAYFTSQVYNVTFSGSNVSFTPNPLQVSYISSSQITLTPANNYYFESISCSTGYTAYGFSSGASHYSTQTITITNNNHVGNGTCTVTMHVRSYAATPVYHVHSGSSSSGGGCYTERDYRTCSGKMRPIYIKNEDNETVWQMASDHTWGVKCDTCGRVNNVAANHAGGSRCTTAEVQAGLCYCSHRTELSTYSLGCGKTEGVTIDSYTCPNGGTLSGTRCVF